MKEYIKKFNDHNAYTAFILTENFIKPNVSLCINENEVHYNPLIKLGYNCRINSIGTGGFTINSSNSGGRNRGLILRLAENGGSDLSDYFIYTPSIDRAISEESWKNYNLAPFRVDESCEVRLTITQSGNDVFYAAFQLWAFNVNNGNKTCTRVYDSGWLTESTNFSIGNIVSGYDYYYFTIAMSKNSRGTSTADQMTEEEMKSHASVDIVYIESDGIDYSNPTITNLYNYPDLLSNRLTEVTTDGFESTWAGGFAINQYEMYQLFNYGYVYALSKDGESSANYDSHILTGKLASAGSQNHANSLSIYSEDISQRKATLVIGQCYGNKACYIENCLKENESRIDFTLKCTILYSGSKFNTSWDWDWTYDRITGKLYAIGYSGTRRWPNYVTSNTSDVKIEVLKFNMPNFNSNAQITLTDSDIIEQYTFSGVGRERQDVSIENGILYYLYSDKTENSTAITTGTNVDGKLLIIDLNKNRELATVDLTSIHLEPEGCCYFNGSVYVTFHKSGDPNADLYIYRISFE